MHRQRPASPGTCCTLPWHLLHSPLTTSLVPPALAPQITCLEWAPVKLAGPQGKVGILASGGSDGRVRLWRAPYVLV